MKFLLKNIKQRYNIRDYRFSLVFLVLTLSIVGVFMVGSARPDLMTRQIMGVGLGVLAMAVISLIDYKWVLSLYWPIYGLNIIMLATVLLFGETRNNATRWLNLGFVQFQPSDLTKILMILFYAKFLMEREETIKNPKTIIQGVALILPSLALIYMQPNLSTTLCIAALFCALMYIAGLSYKIIGGIVGVAVPLFIVAMLLITQTDLPIIDDYQKGRIMSWLYPEDEEYEDLAIQQNNSITAIGSGQLTGKGYNNNSVSSANKGNFVSQIQTDFIFAVAGEELGFVGSAGIVILLLLIVIECILTSRRAKDLSGKIICCGVAAVVGFQSFLNICVATGLLPNTGTPLPFVSYGLTSLVSLYIGMGLVLNVGLQNRRYLGGEKNEYRIYRP